MSIELVVVLAITMIVILVSVAMYQAGAGQLGGFLDQSLTFGLGGSS